jgi:hypothetical protein
VGTIREEAVGKSTVRLLKMADGYAGLVIGRKGAGEPIFGDDPDALWQRLIAEVGKAHPSYFGFDGARARFLRYFPGGFADPGYIAEEREYKDKAIAKIRAIVSLESAREAGPGHCADAVRAFQATNLVFPVEKARIKEVLNGAHGVAFLKAAAQFADGDAAGGLSGMIAAVRPTSQPSWPMLTYLPFMWRPDQHMFLKPAVTRDFADRVGHSFGRDYEEGLKPGVYERLLDLASKTQCEIADLAPRDLVDVQSFIWVVGAYQEAAPA